MNEAEEYQALQSEVNDLASVTVGGFTPHRLARLQAQSGYFSTNQTTDLLGLASDYRR
jgi:hypothetical protein